MDEIKIAKMTGSEKQIAWATDIITRPYTDMMRRIKIFEEQLHQPEHAAACRKAMATYREAYERASAMDPNMTIAARIIEKKSFFSSAMDQALQMAIAGSTLKRYEFDII